MRLIDANEVHNLVRNAKKYMWYSPISSDRKVTVSTDDIQFGVDKIPTIEPEAIHEPTASEFKRMAVQMGYEPVRRGRWEMTKDGAAWCSACKRKMNPCQYGYPRCAICGAKMDEVSE